MQEKLVDNQIYNIHVCIYAYIYASYYDWNKCEIFSFPLEPLEILKIVCQFMYCLSCWIWLGNKGQMLSRINIRT